MLSHTHSYTLALPNIYICIYLWFIYTHYLIYYIIRCIIIVGQCWNGLLDVSSDLHNNYSGGRSQIMYKQLVMHWRRCFHRSSTVSSVRSGFKTLKYISSYKINLQAIKGGWYPPLYGFLHITLFASGIKFWRFTGCWGSIFTYLEV